MLKERSYDLLSCNENVGYGIFIFYLKPCAYISSTIFVSIQSHSSSNMKNHNLMIFIILIVHMNLAFYPKRLTHLSDQLNYRI